MCDIFLIVCNMLPPQCLFRLSFIFSATAPSPGEGLPPPAGPLPPASSPAPPASPPAAANGRHVYAELHFYTACVQVLRSQAFSFLSCSSCSLAPTPTPTLPPTLEEGGSTRGGEQEVGSAPAMEPL